MAGITGNQAAGKPKQAQPLLDPRPYIVPGTGQQRIFRALIPGACRYRCAACPFGSPARERDAALEGLARTFLLAYRRGWCDGLFVTAGVPSGHAQAVWSTEKMLELVEILRIRHGFQGYIHAKTVAGATAGQLERLVRLVDRVSSQPDPACLGAMSGAGASQPTDHTHNPPRSSQGNGRAVGLAAALARGTAEQARRKSKAEWALSHPDFFPVELTTAPAEDLRRLPGYGTRKIAGLLKARGSEAQKAGRRESALPIEGGGKAPRRAAGLVTYFGRYLGLRSSSTFSGQRQRSLFEGTGTEAR